MDIPDERISEVVSRVTQAEREGLISPPTAENLTIWLSRKEYRDYFEDIAARVDAGDFKELEDLFWQQIPFGTGGRRGQMAEYGSATINERTIAESANGMAVYLKQATGNDDGRAVVACDTRNRSQKYAELVATTLAAHGIKVFLFETFRSTPELSFAVRHLKCDMGAMISASHNPPSDNGIKAYWNTGGQVLPPHDGGIIKCVQESGEIPQIALADAIEAGRIEIVGSEVDDAYLDAVLGMSLLQSRELVGLYSPLHGVGATNCWQVLERAGFEGLALFEPHCEPDGNFPNVPDQFPNPERPAVFVPMFDEARQRGAEILLASDPDADRLAACVRNSGGEYVHMTGNQIGALLTDFVLRKRTERGDLSPEHYVVETLVTSRLIGDLARAHGVRIIDDLLVGFKYIGQTIDDEGPERFVFGCEESLGYLAGTYARDKDAGIAALYLAECAAELRESDRSLLDRLDELYVEHGYYLESQLSKVCTGSEGSRQIEQLMAAFRETPPTDVGGVSFSLVRDYQRHEVRSLPGNRKSEDLADPSGNLLMLETASDADPHVRIAVRPSGTEPKIKFYLFQRASCGAADSLPAVKTASESLNSDLSAALLVWIDEQLANDE
ncbi:MAG: phospho-sugar mutase [Planctomycetota bacterium]|nr:MAG: phospho-sugar mutase [Planctomycetota bacterium]